MPNSVAVQLNVMSMLPRCQTSLAEISRAPCTCRTVHPLQNSPQTETDSILSVQMVSSCCHFPRTYSPTVRASKADQSLRPSPQKCSTATWCSPTGKTSPASSTAAKRAELATGTIRTTRAANPRSRTCSNTRETDCRMCSVPLSTCQLFSVICTPTGCCTRKYGRQC